MTSNIPRTERSNANAGTAVNSSAEAESLPRRAYVTTLSGNGDDVEGVRGLAKGLRKVESKYPLVVAVLANVPKEHRKILDDLGCIVKKIEWVCSPKLRIWQFVEYSKMIYLEGNVQVYSNIDHLFDLKDGYIYAPCLPWPASLIWPTEFNIPQPSFYFNASMFVFEPGAPIFDDLSMTIASIPSIPFAAEQRVLILLNMFFREKLMGLPEHYYWALTMPQNHKENVDLNKVKVIQYCSPELKPWRYTPKGLNVDIELVNKLQEKWLCIYHGE